jgi:hypothetical protein
MVSVVTVVVSCCCRLWRLRFNKAVVALRGFRRSNRPNKLLVYRLQYRNLTVFRVRDISEYSVNLSIELFQVYRLVKVSRRLSSTNRTCLRAIIFGRARAQLASLAALTEGGVICAGIQHLVDRRCSSVLLIVACTLGRSDLQLSF